VLLPLLQVCVASGKAIREGSTTLRCKTCRHHMLTTEISGRQSCPLCHGALQQPQQQSQQPPQQQVPGLSRTASKGVLRRSSTINGHP
jgi:hypothetical protein